LSCVDFLRLDNKIDFSKQSLAGSFFASCPDGSAPTIKPFPPATVANATAAKIGSTISVSIDSSLASNGTLYCGFASNVQAAFSPYTNGQCEIPTANVTGGQVYGVVTNAQVISDATTVAGPFSAFDPLLLNPGANLFFTVLNLDTQNNTSSGSESASGSSSNKAKDSSSSAWTLSIPATLLAVAGALSYFA
jgi:hypothetical protein